MQKKRQKQYYEYNDNNKSQKNIEYYHELSIKKQKQVDNKSYNGSNRSSSSRFNKNQYSFKTNINGLEAENRALIKKIQELNKEIAKYQRIANRKEDYNTLLRNIQAELAQTYRVINYYEGKLSQIQTICLKYETSLQNQTKKSKKNQQEGYLTILRQDNIQLKGQLQTKIHQNTKLTTQLRKKQDIHQMREHKIIELNRQIAMFKDNFKEKMPNIESNYSLKSNPDTPVKEKTLLKRRPIVPSLRNKIESRSKQNDSQSDSQLKIKNYKKSLVNSNSKIKLKNINKQQQIKSQYFNEQKIIKKHNKTPLEDRQNLVKYDQKLKSLDEQVQKLRLQNEQLNKQLDLLVKQNIELKQSINQLNDQAINIEKNKQNFIKKITIDKNLLKQISAEKIKSNSIQKDFENRKISSIVSNSTAHSQSMSGNRTQIKIKTYKFKRIQDKTLRKLITNVARNDLSYLTLINTLTQLCLSSNFTSLKQFLGQSPCDIDQKDIEQFINQFQEIKLYIQAKQNQKANKDLSQIQHQRIFESQIKNILKDNIEYFKNITIRKDYSLNIQLSNKFKNYQDEIEQIVHKYKNRMSFPDAKKLFLKWGLSNEQLLFVMIKNKEQFNDLEFIHFEDLANYFLMS